MTSTTTVLAAFVLLSSAASAQQYVISTYAGGAPPVAVPVQGTSISIGGPIGVAIDEKGNVYFASPDLDTVFKLDASGVLARIAGSSKRGYAGGGGPATEAQLNLIFGNSAAPSSGLAIDKAGNLFIADTSNQCVRRVSPTGIMTTVAGTGVAGFSGDGGPAVDAKLVYPGGVALDRNGLAAPILYTSATQVAAIVPYAVSGSAARRNVMYHGQFSADFTVPVTTAAPNVFTSKQAGWGRAAAINAVDGTINTSMNPVQIGGYISLYVTGEGQTLPAAVDGKLAASEPAHPVLPVSVRVGGIQPQVQYAGGVPGQVAGLSQVNVHIPSGVQPGGYVPMIVQAGERISGTSVWIAVSN